MGHKAGEGIGKSVKGMAAPIEVSLKPGRTGLGVDEERKRKKDSIRAQQTERGGVSPSMLVPPACTRTAQIMHGLTVRIYIAQWWHT